MLLACIEENLYNVLLPLLITIYLPYSLISYELVLVLFNIFNNDLLKA